MKKPVTLTVTGFSLAQWEGFEPSSGFSRYTISNRARYDLFDTAANGGEATFLLTAALCYIIAVFFLLSREFSNFLLCTTHNGEVQHNDCEKIEKYYTYHTLFSLLHYTCGQRHDSQRLMLSKI